jgi:hypothetical protein
MDGELMKNLRECECDDREISSARRHEMGCCQVSSSFASAETSIPKEALGFAKWHPDSHFWSIFASFCLPAIPQGKNGILIQDKNRAAAAACGLPLSLNSW